MTTAAGRVAASPLLFCDARNGTPVIAVIEALAVRRALRVAVCDWTPDLEELRSIEATSRRHGLTVVLP